MSGEPEPAPAVGTGNERTRERWLAATLAALPAGWRILDAGAGEQPYRPLCAHLRYVSQDLGRYRPEQDGRGLQMPSWEFAKLDIVSDIAAIPEPDGAFDAVLCSEVFEHLPDPLPALREFARLLRPGGELIVTAPFCSLTHFAPDHHASGFSRFWYERHLPEHGFELLELTPNGNFFEWLAQELLRLPHVSWQYAELAPAPADEAALDTVLRFLARASARGGASSELLCFGWHVRARRR